MTRSPKRDSAAKGMKDRIVQLESTERLLVKNTKGEGRSSIFWNPLAAGIEALLEPEMEMCAGLATAESPVTGLLTWGSAQFFTHTSYNN
jgi:hypothetical protein